MFSIEILFLSFCIQIKLSFQIEIFIKSFCVLHQLFLE
nr:MAG TPA: hypothetical protein [Caudoviricetes sp.]